MPVRKIPMGRRSLTGAHHWDPRARGVAFESSLERDFITLMLLESSVLSIEEQPVKIHFYDRERNRSYVPDFLVHFKEEPSRLIEIKYREELDRKADEFTPKFEAAANYAQERGWHFEVWTDEEIRTQRLEHAKFLVPFVRQAPDPGISARIISFLRTNNEPETCIDDVLNRCWNAESERSRGLRAIWSLIAHRRLQVDLDLPLDKTTVLRLCEDTADA